MPTTSSVVFPTTIERLVFAGSRLCAEAANIVIAEVDIWPIYVSFYGENRPVSHIQLRFTIASHYFKIFKYFWI